MKKWVACSMSGTVMPTWSTPRIPGSPVCLLFVPDASSTCASHRACLQCSQHHPPWAARQQAGRVLCRRDITFENLAARGSVRRLRLLFEQVELGLPLPPTNPGLLELSVQGQRRDATTGPLQGVPLEQDHHLLRVFGVSEDARPEAPGFLTSLGVGVEDLPPEQVISDLVPLEQVGHDRSPPSRRAPVRVNLSVFRGQDATPPAPAQRPHPYPATDRAPSAGQRCPNRASRRVRSGP